MDTLRTLMRQEKQHEIVIFVLLVLYIIFTPSVPVGLAEYAESTYGQIIVIVIAITVFKHIRRLKPRKPMLWRQ